MSPCVVRPFFGLPSRVLTKTVSESLGNATLGVTARFYNVHYVDDVDQPFARYLFRYRPLGKDHNLSLVACCSFNYTDIFQAHGIAPQDPPRERSAGPGPSTDRRDTGKRPSEGVTSSPAAKKRRGDGSKVHIKLEGEHREKSFRRKQVDEMKVWSPLCFHICSTLHQIFTETIGGTAS